MRNQLLTTAFVWSVIALGLMPAMASAPRILVLGDSLSVAYNMDTEDGWVALLESRLGPGAEVINAAIGGDTTAGALARFPQALATHQPDIVIIALGGNDGLRGVALDEFRGNLIAMITAAQNSGASVVLAGVRLPSNYGSAFINQFLAVYENVAAQTDVALVPMILAGVAEDPTLMQDDGIHPNEAAQPKILNNIWTALAPMLPAQTAQ